MLCHTFPDKTEVFAVQGFGRFGLLGPSNADSTVRFDRSPGLRRDPLGPLGLLRPGHGVSLGLCQFLAGQPPTALALVVWAIVASTVVTLYLPMAWDRYFLPIQSANALLAATAVGEIWKRWRHHGAIVRRPETWVFLILIASYASSGTGATGTRPAD